MRQSDLLLSESLLRSAIIENHQREMEAILSTEADLAFSEGHNRRMNALFVSERTKRTFVSVRRFLIRAIAIIAIVFSLFGLSMLINPGVRASVANVIVEWYKTFTNFRGADIGDMPATQVEPAARRTPLYLPKGFSETHSESVFGNITVEYQNNDGMTIYFYSAPSNALSDNVDNEHTTYSVVEKSNTEFHVFESADGAYPSSILWSVGGYYFRLTGYCPLDELWKMAESLD